MQQVMNEILIIIYSGIHNLLCIYDIILASQRKYKF